MIKIIMSNYFTFKKSIPFETGCEPLISELSSKDQTNDLQTIMSFLDYPDIINFNKSKKKSIDTKLINN